MTYYEDESNYYEPTEADYILTEYVEKMKTALLDSVKNEIEQLRNKNSELIRQNKIWESEENDVYMREKKLEYEKEDLMRTVRKERLTELLKDFNIQVYSLGNKYVKGPKCDKCNDDRKIIFKSPSGKDMSESCSCDVSHPVFIPAEETVTSFRINERNDKKLDVWYKAKKSYDGKEDYYDYNGSVYAECYWKDGDKFMKKTEKKLFFVNLEDCQKYCDWLNLEENK